MSRLDCWKRLLASAVFVFVLVGCPSTPNTPTPTTAMSPVVPTPVEQPKRGFLSINSVPLGQVRIGGRPVGSTPILRLGVPPGKHTIALENPKCETATREVEVIEHEETKVIVKLECGGKNG